jgi:hypothetical protein
MIGVGAHGVNGVHVRSSLKQIYIVLTKLFYFKSAIKRHRDKQAELAEKMEKSIENRETGY